jgi:hypothetical protein
METKKKLFYFYLFLSFIVPFIVYYLTTNPNLTFTDNGELAGVCSTLGIAHPTGYPLFTILGYLWHLLPLSSNKIFQLNLFAAFWTSVAVSLFFIANVLFLRLIQIKLSRNRDQSSRNQPSREDNNKIYAIYLISLITSLVFAFSRTIWGEATSLEVYSLQLALFNLLFLCIFLVLRHKYEFKYLALLAFVLGLSFSNHLTTLLIVPVFLVMYFRRQGEKIEFSRARFKNILLLSIPFLIGISFYLYLPLRSQFHPPFNWGWVSRSWDKFFYHISGKQYRVWMFSSLDTVGENLNKFIAVLPFEFAWIGLLFVVIGFFYLWKKQLYLLSLLLISLFACLFYSLNYQIHDIETYFSLALISLFFILSAGLYYLWEKARNWIYITMLIPMGLIAMNFAYNDDSKNDLVVTYTKNLVDNLEQNAVVISAQWDYFCSPFWYLQRVGNYRSDVVLVEKELLRRTWYLEQLRRWYPNTIGKSKKEIDDFLEQLELFESGREYDAQLIQFRFVRMLQSFVEKNIAERPVYITYDILQNPYDSKAFEGFEILPQGFALRLLPNKSALPINLNNVDVVPFVRFKNKSSDHMVKGIIEATRVNLTNLSYYAQSIGDSSARIKLIEMIQLLQ